MRVRDNEIDKINNANIRRYEKILSEIDKYEASLLEDFDKNIQAILGSLFVPIIKEINKNPSIIQGNCRTVRINNEEYKIPNNLLMVFHKSLITDPNLKKAYEDKLKMWFKDKTTQIKNAIKDKDNYDDVIRVLPPAYALASIALTTFHKHPNMILRDVQKMTGIAISEGDIAELGTGEGKTLAAVLPTYLFALRGKGAHVITANGYLAKRDFEETLPIYEGLGLSSGYLPEDESVLAEIEGKDINNLSGTDRIKLQEKLKRIKQDAYRRDITYGSKQTFAFDYLRDNSITKKEDMIQRPERPGFALIDEVDDALIDDAQVPYRIAIQTPMYDYDMSLRELCILQNVSYEEILPQVQRLNINLDKLSYEEARYISNTYLKKELLLDPRRYQEAADRFFRMQKVLVTEDNTYGFRTGKELYKAIVDDDKYDAEEIRRKYGIILCRELREFKISDKCYEDFLKYCYFSFQINSEVLSNQSRIARDPNYKQNEDYIIDKDGRMKLTMKGAEKILHDKNYPDFIDNYNKYLSAISRESTALLHYFQQAVIANLLMKNGEDYSVVNGRIKTLKNGRVQEGSTYSNGLHQALEIKEKIPSENRTKETTASSTITQKDFYSRYDIFSGMTGTSSKEVFREVFGKQTVEIPKHAFYSFFSRRKKSNSKEPIGVEKKDTKFTRTREDKIKLILESIIESQSMNPKQPILLVVSDVDEIALLELALKANNINFNTLTSATSKEDEALIIARAGLPGMVTISTEMAGRGTDIKIGGDRETIIDIATARHIRALEKKQHVSLNFTQVEKDFLRKKVELALTNSQNHRLWSKEEEIELSRRMETTGLKVISSGFFRVNRVDRQLEGRTGRNGISGVCERFACPDDLKKIGLTSFNMKDSINDFFSRFAVNRDGSIALDARTYSMVMEKIETRQKNNEAEIKASILYTQELDGCATKMVEEYRDKRRKIICDDVDIRTQMYDLIENATDAIISSYILKEELEREDLTTPINMSGLEVDALAISLEAKQVLGITIDPNVVTKSNINLLELRDAIIRTAKQRVIDIPDEELKDALLAQNDFMIANIPDILEHSFIVRRLTSMSPGMESQAEYNADREFVRARQKLFYESNKQGARKVLGLPLTREEFKKLESIRSKMFGLSAKKTDSKSKEYEVSSGKAEENNVGVIERFKMIKAKVDERNKRKLEKIEQEVTTLEKKGKQPNVSALYSKLEVRPMKFINAIVDGKSVCKLVLVRQRIIQEESKGASLR